MKVPVVVTYFSLSISTYFLFTVYIATCYVIPYDGQEGQQRQLMLYLLPTHAAHIGSGTGTRGTRSAASKSPCR